jgi:ribose 5-phosphate isomerase B
MKIYIASDHAGFALKAELVPFLLAHRFDVTDLGPAQYNHDDDYPDYISRVAEKISEENAPDESLNGSDAKGIIIGWSGQGEAIVANRFSCVRAAVFYGGPKHVLTLSRQHNDANVLSLGAHFLTSGDAKKAVLLWLGTEFSGEERHERRIKKIEQYSK